MSEAAATPKKRRGCLAIFYLAMILVVSAAVANSWFFRDPPPLHEREFGSPASGKRVLVVSQDTEFRQRLVEQLVKDLSREGCYIWITDVQMLPHTPLDSFRAVVILDTVRAWNLHDNTRAALARPDAAQKIIVVPCAGDAEFALKADGIDAITAASPGGDVPTLANKILAAVRKRFPSEAESESPAATKTEPTPFVETGPFEVKVDPEPENLAPPEITADQE